MAENDSAKAAEQDTPKSNRIGGPGTCLPTFAESFLSWALAISCLGVSGYHYIRTTVAVPVLTYVRVQVQTLLVSYPRALLSNNYASNEQHLPYEKVWVPLTTCSRAELDRATPKERYDQLVQVLEKILYAINDDGIVVTLRRHHVLRRLASLAMRPYLVDEDKSGTSTSTTTLLKEYPELDIVKCLARVWPMLLQLPPLKDTYPYQISLILPAFRENGYDTSRKLRHASDCCVDPQRVEVVLVDAGGCKNLDIVERDHRDQWGQIKTSKFSAGGGRGPCLNYGASMASGRILTFCHSDTRLPRNWDASLVKAFDDRNRRARSNSCAFSFGIDTSPAGLNGGSHPPGIKAVETTANLRTHMYSLPYGDQCISVPSDIFHYLGGYPDQCLMEDYEMVTLLRKRSVLLAKLGVADREQLYIIGGHPALCSPRRWQKFGVLYVTWMNSKFVNLYAAGLSPDGLFRLYYGGSPPKRDRELSPWEIELQEILQDR